jgi:phage terminase small subunit
MSESTALEVLTPLDKLNPRLRLAVEFYTNPMFGRTFGNKTKSALAAGYEKVYAVKVLSQPQAKEAIHWVMQQKDADSQHVAKFLERFSMDAARKLVEQVGLSDGLTIHPMPEGLLDKKPEPIIGCDKDGEEKLLGFDDSHLKQAKAITDHNKAVASAAREVREAVKLLLAYQLGTPEQKVSVEHNRGGSDPLDLGELSDDELRNLQRHIQEVREFKQGAGLKVKAPPPEESEASVLEAEVVDD